MSKSLRAKCIEFMECNPKWDCKIMEGIRYIRVERTCQGSSIALHKELESAEYLIISCLPAGCGPTIKRRGQKTTRRTTEQCAVGTWARLARVPRAQIYKFDRRTQWVRVFVSKYFCWNFSSTYDEVALNIALMFREWRTSVEDVLCNPISLAS